MGDNEAMVIGMVADGARPPVILKTVGKGQKLPSEYLKWLATIPAGTISRAGLTMSFVK